MAMITLTSTNSNLAQRLSIERCNSNLREASFSSYLNSTEESFVQKLAESSRDFNPDIPKGKDEDGEIGIFGAEKYFNGVIDHEESTTSPRTVKLMTQYKKVDDDDDNDIESAVRPRMLKQPGTPSVGSESSGNSQSILLNSIRKTNASQIKTKKVNGKSFLGGLSCKWSCLDKNSVNIQEQVGEVSFSTSRTASSLGSVQQGKGSSTKSTIKSSSTGPEFDVLQVNKTHSGSWARDTNVIDRMGVVSKRETNLVTFPGLKTHSQEAGKDFHKKIQFEKENNQEMKLRKSLEVFGSPIHERRSKSLALDHIKRPTTMLSSWDANSKMKAELELELYGGIYSDYDSDGSSDLFELETLTGKSDPYLKRQVSDVTLSDCVTPCYAPSEASIEWSVVTASAADFSTICASDYEDQLSLPISSTANAKNKTFLSVPYARMRENKDGHRKGSGPSILQLGCNSQKAVQVAGDCLENSKKSFDTRMRRRRSDSFMPDSKFQAEYSKKHFDTRHGLIASMSPSHLPVSRPQHS